MGRGSEDDSLHNRVKTLNEVCLVYVDGDYTDTSYVEYVTCRPDGRVDVDEVRYAGGTSCTINYVYEGDRLVRKDCGFDGQQPASIFYHYDMEGRVTAVSDSENPMPVETYRYGDKSYKEWTYIHDGQSDSILTSYHSTYDLAGRVTEEVQYGVESENQVLGIHSFVYDGKGNLVEEKIENEDGLSVVTYDYAEFDEHGSWTLCYKNEFQMPSGTTKKSITTRKLTYY